MSHLVLSEVVYCNIDCDTNHGRCTGHAVTVDKDKTRDMVTVVVDGKRMLFDDKVFAEIVRMWSAEE